MSYRIQVTRLEKNPEYEEQVKAAQERSRYQNFMPSQLGGNGWPIEYQEVAVLTVELDEEQYNAVKRAVLETWK